MRISLKWLEDYVDIEMSPNELAHRLTMNGLEVEGMEAVGQLPDEIVVAKILTVSPHSEADYLSICQVDIGKEKLQVVCGAPNIKQGMLAPIALVGTKLPNGMVISENKIKGENSKGMLLAEDEMGLTDDHEGLMALPSGLTPGTSVSSSLDLSDWVFDIGLTPNRPDCASVVGVARELAAITGKKLMLPEIKIQESGQPIEALTSVTIDDPAACPRYAADIINDIVLGPSPFQMRYRLYLAGIRSINNVVDVTNYVMLETGQPLHAFDYDRLRENRIVVRRAQDGETFSTLDGETHTLSNETLMICDGERPVAVAGIMGGLNSEIFAGTRHILVESAFFDPVTIRRGSKKLGISTEASYRFERGADIEGVTMALNRAISLISRLGGGKIAKGSIDNYPKPYTPPVIDLRVDKTNRILGTSVSKDAICGYLKSLDMEVREINENELRVKPPSFRVDIAREVDLMEEVARMSGFDNIPVTYPSIRPSEKEETPEIAFFDQTRSIMVNCGFREVITYSFISPDSADMLGAEAKSPLRSFVELLNPLTADQSVMRTSLIPGLLNIAKTNIQNQKKDLRLFELGKIFLRKEKNQLPHEKFFLTAVMTGLSHQRTWYRDERYVDYYDVKGAAEALLEGIGIQGLVFQKKASALGYDHVISSDIFYSDYLIGHLGRVSEDVMKNYDLKEDAYLFELDLETVSEKLPSARKFQPFVKFPAVYRDISIIVPRRLESTRIMEIIEQGGMGLIESIQIFDLYEGEKMDSSQKALAFKICYRSKHGTLDGVEINRVHESIIKKIRKETGGNLREG